MMNPFSFFSKAREEVFLAMDIGAEAVKALVVKGAASLSYFDEFGVFNNHNFRQSVLKKAMTNALSEIQKETNGKLKKIIISLPPDAFKARVASYSLKRNYVKKLIGREEAKKIYTEAIQGAQDGVARAYAKESGILPDHLGFLRSTFLRVKIDGYEVKDIAGYDGNNLEFKILSVFMPKNYLNDFEIIAKELDLRIINIVHPFENLNYIFSEASGVFLDVGGDITQFCIMDKGIPVTIGDFKMGGINFSQTLSRALGLSEESARNLKERYSNRDLTEDARKRVEDICASAVAEWTSELKERLAKSGNIIHHKIYIWGGGSQFFGLTDSLSQEQWDIERVSSPQFFNSILLSHALK